MLLSLPPPRQSVLNETFIANLPRSKLMSTATCRIWRVGGEMKAPATAKQFCHQVSTAEM